jgi:hypothetical protein
MLNVIMLSVVTPEKYNLKTERTSNVVTIFIIQKFQKHLYGTYDLSSIEMSLVD